MPEDHPDEPLLERFMRSEAGAEERRRIVRHLLAGCPRCVETTRYLWRLSEAYLAEPLSPTGTPPGDDSAFRRSGSRRLASALHRQALLLTEAGCGEEALGALRQARRLYEVDGDGPNLARLRRLEGRIEEALGSWQAAESAFHEARQRFLAEGLGAEAAAALLDLALLYQRQGRAAAIHALAEDLLPILQARGIRQGAAAALLFFRDLVETGHATAEVLFAVSRYLSGPVRALRARL